jgi:hypothetical protein
MERQDAELRVILRNAKSTYSYYMKGIRIDTPEDEAAKEILNALNSMVRGRARKRTQLKGLRKSHSLSSTRGEKSGEKRKAGRAEEGEKTKEGWKNGTLCVC